MSAAETAGGRPGIRALVLGLVIAYAIGATGAAHAGEAEAVAVAVTSATGVTTTSAMVADFAALESAYAANGADVEIARSGAEAVDFDTLSRDLDTLPRELASVDRDDPSELRTRTDVSMPIVMLEQPKIGPLVMEQPMRVYYNDVTVKLRAPGRRRSFATVEVHF